MNMNTTLELLGTDIIKRIFLMLNIENRLNLAQVNYFLKDVYTNTVSKIDYRKLWIIKKPPYFHVNNHTGMNCLKLNAKELEAFLNLYEGDIEELNDCGYPCLDIKKFPNLTSLSYKDMSLNKSQLLDVAKYCQKLQSLSIKNCLNEDEQDFQLCRDLTIKKIMELKELKHLHITSSETFPLKYSNFFKLITETKIKNLILLYYLEKNDYLPLCSTNNPLHLEYLSITIAFKEISRVINFSNYSKLFSNLYHLELNEIDEINEHNIEMLTQTCKHLKELTFTLTNFKNITNFHKFKSLEILIIVKSKGLTHKNLRQILKDMNLLKFCSLQTEYEGEFRDFPISKKIEYLNLDPIKTYKFKGAYEEHHNLKTLFWYGSFNKTSLDVLLKLRSLENLEIKISSKDLCWSYITDLLLHHVSLKEFTLKNMDYDDLNSVLSSVEEFEYAGNLKKVTVSYHFFVETLDFWFHLFATNYQLILTSRDTCS